MATNENQNCLGCNSTEVIVYDHNLDNRSPQGPGPYCSTCWGNFPLKFIDDDSNIIWQPISELKENNGY